MLYAYAVFVLYYHIEALLTAASARLWTLQVVVDVVGSACESSSGV